MKNSKKHIVTGLLATLIFIFAPFSLANDIIVTGKGAAPEGVTIEGIDNDDGSHLIAKWLPSKEVGFNVIGYEVLLSTSASGPFKSAGLASSKDKSLELAKSQTFPIEYGVDYFGKVVALDSTVIAVRDSSRLDTMIQKLQKQLRRSESEVIGPFRSQAAWFHTKRINVFLIIVLFFSLVIYLMKRARNGHQMKFRRLAGIDAMDEAIGRATELGKPILYIPGTQNIEEIQTIASIQLLSSVSSKAAAYDIPIIVPLNRPFMVTVAEEAVKQGYLNAGRPDAYVPDNIRYLSDEQFAFTAGVTGIIVREKTAAHFYLGAFYAESLILSETGFSAGAIQIAGTANVHQLPFFVVACDYTLLGEEYFAASAFVTQDANMLGTIKATDYIKAILIAILLLTIILELFDIKFLSQWFTSI